MAGLGLGTIVIVAPGTACSARVLTSSNESLVNYSSPSPLFPPVSSVFLTWADETRPDSPAVPSRVHQIREREIHLAAIDRETLLCFRRSVVVP